MSVNVPDLLTLSKDITFEIKDEAGNIIGTAVANHLTGVVTVTFLKLVENATSDIKGSFSVWVNWEDVYKRQIRSHGRRRKRFYINRSCRNN